MKYLLVFILSFLEIISFGQTKVPHLLAFHPPTPIHCQIIPTAVSAHVGIPFTHSHPLQNYTDRRCWFAAKEVAEHTNNNKSIPNYKRFSVF